MPLLNAIICRGNETPQPAQQTRVYIHTYIYVHHVCNIHIHTLNRCNLHINTYRNGVQRRSQYTAGSTPNAAYT